MVSLSDLYLFLKTYKAFTACHAEGGSNDVCRVIVCNSFFYYRFCNIRNKLILFKSFSFQFQTINE